MSYVLWLSLWLTLCQNVASDDVSALAATSKETSGIGNDVAERMEMMDEKLKRLQTYTENLEQRLEHTELVNERKFVDLEKTIKLLEQQLMEKTRKERMLENAFRAMARRMNRYRQVINDMAGDLDQLKEGEEDENEQEGVVDETVEVPSGKKYEGRIVRRSSNRQGRQTTPNHAFSVYLTETLSGLAQDHIIRFAGISHNEGSGYNQFTGIFTAPKSGVYLFSFFIEDTANHRLRVKLVLNNTRKSSAVAYPYTAGRNIQGGNVVILRIIAGASVWIAIDESGDTIAGSSTYKTSTFSGIYLHA